MKLPTCRLDELADIRLGVKTFLNPFFYVDQQTIARFNIEKQYLEPVFRTGDAKRDSFKQASNKTKLSIFLCNQDEATLTGTGAAAYIKWGSTQRHKGANGRVGGLWKDTPAVKPHEREWYKNQAMPPPARIVLLKAFDEYFAPFILDKAIRVDQRFNQVNRKAGVSEGLLIGLFSSTWFVMLCETFGRTAMGQGALELPTNSLRALPVPDLRKLNRTQARAWEKATASLLTKKRLPAWKSRQTKAQRDLDECVLRALGVKAASIRELYDDVARMTNVRELLAAGRGTIKRERFAADVGHVAENIAAQLKSLLAGRRFPDDFVRSGAATTPITLGTAPISITAELMLGQRHVTVKSGDHTIFDASLPNDTGELFIRAVESGQRTFNLPDGDAEAGAALIALDQLVNALAVKLDDLAATASGSVQAALSQQVERHLNFPLTRLARPIPGSYTAEL
jgi:hypothetical protein